MKLMDTAIILAGGASRRMGFDKQFINIGNTSITEYLIESLRPIFESIILITNRPECYTRKEIIISEDLYKGFGPLGGIHAGLIKSQSMYNYIIACDMPYINNDYIKYMMMRIRDDDYKKQAVITRFGDWIEPFNAFYCKSLIPIIQNSILTKQRKISDLLVQAEVLYIDEDIAKGFSPDWSMFTNLNNEEDLSLLNRLKIGGEHGIHQRDNSNKIR